VTLTDLCQACGLSRRTLFYSFEQTLGVSPMKYLKVLRLQGVRRALQAANPDHYTVQGLAYNFGFWSMGHFARDYKTLFGESPAQTLAAGQL
jgi:AraC family ethanolamine operon transcriptional activator